MSHHKVRAPKRDLLESDLYPIIARFFEEQGYKVKGEVLKCDLVALKDERLVIVELKKTFNIKLLYQAVRRLALTENVYAAIFRPPGRQKMAFWSMVKSLSRRLQIGMLMVDGTDVKIICEPKPFLSHIVTRQKNKLLQEFVGRRVSENTGGVTGVKLQTAYLENAIHISILLKKFKAQRPTELVSRGATVKAARILYDNHYGWFEKNLRGMYKLKRGMARQIASKNPAIWSFYEDWVTKTPMPQKMKAHKK